MAHLDIEQLKKEKDGLAVIDDIYRYAKEGYHAITEDDFIRFKWWGLYQQKPKDSGNFMLRVRISGGHYNSRQLRALASISKDFGKSLADITTRQTFQFHWLRIEDVPEIFRRIQEVGLTTSGACGDIMRNITGCPVAGIDPDEVFNAQPDIEKVVATFVNRPEYSNLPRKYKITMSGCSVNCSFPQINCLAFVGVEHGPEGVNEEGYNIYIGGGLSTAPHFAKPVDIFSTRDQVIEYVTAVTDIYRDHGGRDRRTRSRLKFLMDDWGPDRFREEIAKRVPFEPMRASGHPLREAHHDHLGVFKQKQAGLNYLGVTVPIGRLTGEQMEKIADIADQFGSGRLANTLSQNFIVFDVPDPKVDAAKSALAALGFLIDPISVVSDCVVCTGKEFCNLAVTETKGLMSRTLDFLSREVNWDSRIRVHMTGCPNNCGQQVVSDIGLQGSQTKVGDELVECYDFHVGGHLGENPQFVRKISRFIAADDVPTAIANVVKAYQASRKDGQSFYEWTMEREDSEIASLLGVESLKAKASV